MSVEVLELNFILSTKQVPTGVRSLLSVEQNLAQLFTLVLTYIIFGPQGQFFRLSLQTNSKVQHGGRHCSYHCHDLMG